MQKCVPFLFHTSLVFVCFNWPDLIRQYARAFLPLTLFMVSQLFKSPTISTLFFSFPFFASLCDLKIYYILQVKDLECEKSKKLCYFAKISSKSCIVWGWPVCDQWPCDQRTSHDPSSGRQIPPGPLQAAAKRRHFTDGQFIQRWLLQRYSILKSHLPVTIPYGIPRTSGHCNLW